MRNIPYQSNSRDKPRSFPLFTKTLVLPHISHSRLSRQFRFCDCHRGDFRLHCLFRPHCSIYRCFECSLPESPILHRKNSRCPSSPNELTISNLFFSYEQMGQSTNETNWITIDHNTHLELIKTLTCLGMV